jgi:hypothetical protein
MEDFTKILDEDDDFITYKVRKRSPAQAQPAPSYLDNSQSTVTPAPYFNAKKETPEKIEQEKEIPFQQNKAFNDLTSLQPTPQPSMVLEAEPIDVEGEFKRKEAKADRVIEPQAAPRQLPVVPDADLIAAQQTENINRATNRQARAEAEAGIVKAKGLENEAAVLEEKMRNQEILLNKQENDKGAIFDMIKDLEDQQRKALSGIKLNKRERTGGERVIAGIAAFLGGLGGGENKALKSINDELDRQSREEIEEFRAKRDDANSRFSFYLKALGSARDAAKLSRADKNDYYADKAKAAALRTKSEMAKANANKLITKLNMDSTKLKNEVANSLYTKKKDAEIEQVKRGAPLQDYGNAVNIKDLKNRDDKEIAIHLPNSNKAFIPVGSKEEIREIKTFLTRTKSVKFLLTAMKNFRDKYKEPFQRLGLAALGATKAFRKDVKKIETVAANMFLAAKDIEELGAVQKWDFPLIENAYPTNPTSWFDSEDGKIKAVDEMIDNSAADTLQQIRVPNVKALYTPSRQMRDFTK